MKYGLLTSGSAPSDACKLTLVTAECFPRWLEDNKDLQPWVDLHGFTGRAGQICSLPSKTLACEAMLVGVDTRACFWALAELPSKLPVASYQLHDPFSLVQDEMYIGWALGAYQFDRYVAAKPKARLWLTDATYARIQPVIESIYWVRDLINLPAEELNPETLADEVKMLADQFQAVFNQVVGEQLLEHNFPTIHRVGRAGDKAPRLLELSWGEPSKPHLILVGKGVCFDTGGLDIKHSSGMLLMKKDMGGAAHVLGLARLIMASNLPLRLTVLIPAVENAISEKAYRPGDVIKTRQGLTVEVGNTDAEGRLVLADALTYAQELNPGLVIDFATLTGAARIALGTELPAFYASDEAMLEPLRLQSKACHDPLWPMPLFEPYRELLKSNIADLNNVGNDAFGGSIIAALFLQYFAGEGPWLHLDLMAWNKRALPGRPIGGDAQGLRAMFAYISDWVAKATP